MFDFGNANEAQIEAIKSTDGPLLIIAGPGTGKTFTLVQRAIYLIQEKGVAPESILIATFTEKAAKELITRISNALLERNIKANINEMYIGTFHSICLRILKEHLEFTNLRKNYRMLDQFDQKYLVENNLYHFKHIENFGLVVPTNVGVWQQAETICNYVNKLEEEFITAEQLKASSNPKYSALGEIMEKYEKILSEQNLIDFTRIQTEAYTLLEKNPNVLKEIQDKISYFMIDEYQDTNSIQEQLLMLLGRYNDNICVVGDDDQGLYRFRGATIRNILEFPAKFDFGKCKIIKLVRNYRSNKDIVDFYNKWMTTNSGKDFNFEWEDGDKNYRYEKEIVANRSNIPNNKAVIKLITDDEDRWCENIYNFITELKDSKKITDLNQIAFLFRSVGSPQVIELANYLENRGINVYSPRSDMFFDREEIRLFFGCLLSMFPEFYDRIEEGEFEYLGKLQDYYVGCIELLQEVLEDEKYEDLVDFISDCADRHADLKKNTDYAFAGLFYQMLEYEPFRGFLSTDMTSGVIDLRPARNLAKLTQILTKFEYLHRVDIFSKKNIDKALRDFFTKYMRFLYLSGIGEYEDDSEYAPSGCVSFLTIHQSKGMEFPIVFTGSLTSQCRTNEDPFIAEILQEFGGKAPYEPLSETKYFDFWRLYYTAFSRAESLLVLTHYAKPNKYFLEQTNKLESYDSPNFDVTAFDFEKIKDVNLKDTFSFTSHILLYKNCAMQYKFYKELEFAPVRVGSTLYGQLVHETIEDIHKAAIRKEADTITPENIGLWFDTNYETLSKNQHSYLGEAQKNAALNSILRYAEKAGGNWEHIQDAEVPVTLVKENYILEGQIDLIKGDGNTVEIVDFKSQKKPDLTSSDPEVKEQIEQYKHQLEVYAHLVEQKSGQKVSKMHIYYTGEENGVPQITFENNKVDVQKTISEFEEIVSSIQKKEFNHKCKNSKTCNECDMRFYCRK
ncbi:MAG: ATP-dependent helicase [Treponema sp.]|nr:ATP-dependent helicase [Treponema sp.]